MVAEKISINGKIYPIGSGTDFTTDGTLTMSKDNVLSVALPSKAITAAEYNALSEEEKMAEVLYILPNDSGDDGEVYSTDEIRIGTWIDGKPLYRKVFSILFPEGTGHISGTQIDNVDLVIKIYGSVRRSAVDIRTFPMSYGSSSYELIYYNGQLYAYDYMDSELRAAVKGKPMYIVTEYTKITDSATV